MFYMASVVQPDVPISVETPARGFFGMVRCHYICIECDTPDSQWQLGVGGLAMPFLMIGLAGIVQQPLGGPRFDTPDVIERFFAQLEQAPSLSINFEDIWVPSTLLRAPTHVGDVYRVGRDLFQWAYRFREGAVSQQDFETYCIEFQRQIIFSEDETIAFTKWSTEQIFRAQDLPPKSDHLRLKVE